MDRYFDNIYYYVPTSFYKTTIIVISTSLAETRDKLKPNDLEHRCMP